jgi:hypothetical protein
LGTTVIRRHAGGDVYLDLQIPVSPFYFVEKFFVGRRRAKGEAAAEAEPSAAS